MTQQQVDTEAERRFPGEYSMLNHNFRTVWTQACNWMIEQMELEAKEKVPDSIAEALIDRLPPEQLNRCRDDSF